MRIHSHYSFLPRIPHHAHRMPSRSDLAVEGTRQVRRCAGYRYSKRSCRAGHMHARTKRMALFENPVLATNAEGTRENQCSIGVHWHVHGKVDALWRTSYLRLMTPYNPHTTTSLIGLLTEDYGGIIPLSRTKHLVPDVDCARCRRLSADIAPLQPTHARIPVSSIKNASNKQI